MVIAVQNLRDWFVPLLEKLPVSSECRAYVVSVLARNELDFIETSVSIAFLNAKMTSDFRMLNRIGDTSIILGTLDPARIFDNGGLLASLSRSAYYSCDNLMMGKWPVYRELADRLECVIEVSHSIIESQTNHFLVR